MKQKTKFSSSDHLISRWSVRLRRNLLYFISSSLPGVLRRFWDRCAEGEIECQTEALKHSLLWAHSTSTIACSVWCNTFRMCMFVRHTAPKDDGQGATPTAQPPTWNSKIPNQTPVLPPSELCIWMEASRGVELQCIPASQSPSRPFSSPSSLRCEERHLNVR